MLFLVEKNWKSQKLANYNMRKQVLLLVIVLCLSAICHSTPLDDYIRKPDPSYSWSVERVSRGTGYTAFAIKLTSQTWLSSAEVDKPVWQHWLNVCVPDKVRLFIPFVFVLVTV